MEVNLAPDHDQIESTSKESVELQQDGRDDASSIRSEALGDNLPPGYFYSPRFIGCLTVSDDVELHVSLYSRV